jgi:hypothetical protein
LDRCRAGHATARSDATTGRLQRSGGKPMDRMLICAAYWICASRRHSGQWSRGYEKLSQLSRIGYNPGRAGWEHEKGSDERNAAAALLWRRRREIRLEW